MAETANKKLELWDGFEVEVNQKLLDDFDFVADLSEAVEKNRITDLTSMYMALVGGNSVYEKIRSHIEQEKGYFSMDELLKIMAKIDTAFPKGGNRASRRSWQNSL